MFKSNLFETINQGLDLLFEQTSAVVTATGDRGWSNSSFGSFGGVLNWDKQPQITKSGNRINGFEALAIGAFFGAVRMIAEDIAKLPLNIFIIGPAGNKIQVNREHPLYGIISLSPDGRRTAQEFWETIFVWTLVWGNGYALISRDKDGQVTSLELVNPLRVSLTKKNGNITYHVSASATDSVATTKRQKYSDMEMFHLRGVGDEASGWPIANFARESLGITLGLQTLQSNMFSNGLNPSGLLMFPEIMKPDHKAGIENEWEAKYSGSQNTGKAMILDGGVDYKPIDFKATDAELLETRKYMDKQVAILLRIPPHKLGIQDASTFNNIEQENLKYLNETLSPWMIRNINNMNRKFLFFDPKFIIEYDTKPLTQTDTETTAKFFSDMIDSGIATPNDGAEALGFDIYEGGDKHFITQNVQPIDQIDIDLEIKKAELENVQNPPEPVPEPKSENEDNNTKHEDEEENTEHNSEHEDDNKEKMSQQENKFDLTQDILGSFQQLIISPIQLVVNREIRHYAEREASIEKHGDKFDEYKDAEKQKHFNQKISQNYIEMIEPYLTHLQMAFPEGYMEKWINYRTENWHDEKAMLMANDLIKHYLQICDMPQGIYELESPNGKLTTVQIDDKGVISELQA